MGGWNTFGSGIERNTPPKTDFGEWDNSEIDLDMFMKEFQRILKNGGTLLCFYDKWKIQSLKESAEKYKFKQPRLCRWDKTNPIPLNSKLNYLSNASEEFCTFVKKSKPTFNSEYDKGIYELPICQGSERTKHPTQKPLALMKSLIEKHSNEGDVVLDCFMGSGSTGVACKELNRSFIGVEIDEEYFEVAKERLSVK